MNPEADHESEIECLPSFHQLLEGYGRAQLSRHEDSVFGLLPDFSLAYFNPAWGRFARENNGHRIASEWGLGANIFDAMSGPVRGLYEAKLGGCLETGRPWQHDYECSSATRYRVFHMDVYPIGSREGLLVINTLVVDRAHDQDHVAAPPEFGLYTDRNGLIAQCSFCRKVQRVDGSELWDWVPEWVAEQPENVTGGLCKPCYRTRFPTAPLHP